MLHVQNINAFDSIGEFKIKHQKIFIVQNHL